MEDNSRKYKIQEAVEHLNSGGVIFKDVENEKLIWNIIRQAGSVLQNQDFIWKGDFIADYGGRDGKRMKLSSISEHPEAVNQVPDIGKMVERPEAVERENLLIENELVDSSSSVEPDKGCAVEEAAEDKLFEAIKNKLIPDGVYGIDPLYLSGARFGYEFAQSQSTQRIKELEEALNGLCDAYLANRGTKDEFVRCRTESSLSAIPEHWIKAKAALNQKQSLT